MGKKKDNCNRVNVGGSPSCIYGLGFVGALFYYWPAETLGQWVMGFVKAMVWPAMFVYQALQMWGA